MRKALMCASALLALAGMATLCVVDWRIFVGVYLMLWSDNIARKVKEGGGE